MHCNFSYLRYNINYSFSSADLCHFSEGSESVGEKFISFLIFRKFLNENGFLSIAEHKNEF